MLIMFTMRLTFRPAAGLVVLELLVPIYWLSDSLVENHHKQVGCEPNPRPACIFSRTAQAYLFWAASHPLGLTLPEYVLERREKSDQGVQFFNVTLTGLCSTHDLHAICRCSLQCLIGSWAPRAPWHLSQRWSARACAS